VVADGLAVAAVREQHRIEALDAATGARKWSFTAGGRVATPPTLYGGLCLFGCRDGWVYALRADTGRLAWKFLAAPYERNIVAFSQVESSWPLLGSLLIHDGLAIAVAGYHPMANGGIHVWALEPHTGAVKWHTTLRRTPEWVDISQPRARIDQPHPTARGVGGFEANTVINNLAYGDDAHVRFSGAVLAASTGELFVPPVPKGKPKGLQGLYEMQVAPTRFLINSDKYPQFRRHYSTEGYFGPYASGSQIIATFPEAKEAIPCVGCAFAGADAVVLQGNKGEGVLRRYDTRKLSTRDAARGDDTPAWSRVLDGDIRAQQKGQKVYHYSSLIVAGDTAVVGGRLKGRAHQSDPIPGMRGVAEGVIKTFDLRSGEPRQTLELDAAPVVSGLAAAGGQLYITCEDGSLRCFSSPQ
jgi:outer membrane protein assembly factor BamB